MLSEWIVGPRELLHELPRVSVHRIQKTPLPFGKEKIKGQRAFARTTHTSNNHEAIAWNLQREVFEIMLACATHSDNIAHRGDSQTASQHAAGSGQLAAQTGKAGDSRSELAHVRELARK